MKGNEIKDTKRKIVITLFFSLQRYLSDIFKLYSWKSSKGKVIEEEKCVSGIRAVMKN